MALNPEIVRLVNENEDLRNLLAEVLQECEDDPYGGPTCDLLNRIEAALKED